MAKLAKFLQGVAGVGGAGLNVEDVFSTYLYDGTGSSLTINNGIDLSGEGGFVWIKARTQNTDHMAFDTERGVSNYLRPNTTSKSTTESGYLVTSFNNNGFTLGPVFTGAVNNSGDDYTSWTFRKAPKFFDVVTYTGTGNENNTINHNLGSVPGMIIVKRTDSTSEWLVYHRGVNGGTNPEQYNLRLQGTDAQDQNSSYFSNTAPTSTTFTVGSLNSASGGSYVAYLFAHNDGDGDFGPTGDQDIIKCGSYTGASPATIDLGFEPQWIMIKRSSGTGDWVMFDAMRGLVVGGSDSYVYANTTGVEVSNTRLNITPTGFITDTTDYRISSNGETYIYIAIRRGPMGIPESATDVFATAFDAGATNPTYVSGFVTDMGIQTNTTGYNKRVSSRLTSGRFLEADNTGAEQTSASNYTWDFMNGWNNQTINSTWLSWMWKRAPNFFDVTCHTGNGQPTQQINHNLGVVPEMAWIKARNNANAWFVYHKDLTSGKNLILNSNAAETTSNANTAAAFYDTYWTPGDNGVLSGGGNTVTYIAYLFASLDGVSKVGSYTGTGSNGNNVDCGFSNGARFVLIRRVNGDEWMVFDTARGITSANNDPKLALDNTGAENQNSARDLNPLNSGFTVNGSDTGMNKLGDTYIFYAIA